LMFAKRADNDHKKSVSAGQSFGEDQ